MCSGNFSFFCAIRFRKLNLNIWAIQSVQWFLSVKCTCLSHDLSVLTRVKQALWIEIMTELKKSPSFAKYIGQNPC